MLKKLFNIYYEWWKNIDKIIFFLIFFLFLLGLFFSLVSTSIIASEKLNTNSYYFFIKHLIFIAVGSFIFISLSLLEKKRLIYFCIILFFLCLFFLALVPILGIEVKGSKRWINLGILPRFQPIELLKPFVIVVLSTLLSTYKIQNLNFKYFLSFLLIAPIIMLLVTQPDIGQTLLLILVWLSLIFISGINLIIFSSFFLFLGSILSYIVIFIPKFAYIKLRLISFLNPTSGNNYQSERASEAIINGGLFGQGIGEGTLNSKVPEAHTDYIISVISEEFGALIVILIMIIFLFLSFKIMKKIDEETNQNHKLILLGCLVLILFQTFIHIGVNIRFLPTTGMTLPFLSYGGSSLLGFTILLFIFLNLDSYRLDILR